MINRTIFGYMLKYIVVLVYVSLIGFEAQYIEEQFVQSLLIPGNFFNYLHAFTPATNVLTRTISILYTHALYFPETEPKLLTWYEELRTKHIIIEKIIKEYDTSKTKYSARIDRTYINDSVDERLGIKKSISDRAASIQTLLYNLRKQDEGMFKKLPLKHKDLYFQFLLVALLEKFGCSEYVDIYKERVQKTVKDLPSNLLTIPTILKYRQEKELAYDTMQAEFIKIYSWSSSESD